MKKQHFLILLIFNLIWMLPNCTKETIPVKQEVTEAYIIEVDQTTTSLDGTINEHVIFDDTISADDYSQYLTYVCEVSREGMTQKINTKLNTAERFYLLHTWCWYDNRMIYDNNFYGKAETIKERKCDFYNEAKTVYLNEYKNDETLRELNKIKCD